MLVRLRWAWWTPGEIEWQVSIAADSGGLISRIDAGAVSSAHRQGKAPEAPRNTVASHELAAGERKRVPRRPRRQVGDYVGLPPSSAPASAACRSPRIVEAGCRLCRPAATERLDQAAGLVCELQLSAMRDPQSGSSPHSDHQFIL